MVDLARARRERIAGRAALRAVWPSSLGAGRIAAACAAALGLSAAVATGIEPLLDHEPWWRGWLGAAACTLGLIAFAAAIAAAAAMSRAKRARPLRVPYAKETLLETADAHELSGEELEIVERIRAHRRRLAPLEVVGGASGVVVGLMLAIGGGLLLRPSIGLGSFLVVAGFGFAGLVGAVRGLGRAELAAADADA